MREHPTDDQWLRSVEQNSWQIELLISGGLLITLYYLPDKINNWLQQAVIETELTTGIVLMFLLLLVLSKALLVGFAANLLLRALWLASLGVHYAYPSGVDYEGLPYDEEIKERLRARDNPTRKVLMLETLSSLSYSMSIFLTWFFLGTMLIVVLMYFLLFEPFLSSDIYESHLFGYGVLLINVIIALGLMDHFVWSRARGGSRWLAAYDRFSQLLSYINLSYFFRYEWRVLNSHIHPLKVAGVSLLYLAIAILLSLTDISWYTLQLEWTPLDHRDYADMRQGYLSIDKEEYEEHYEANEYRRHVTIQSEVIKDRYLDVFVPYDEWYDNSLRYLYEKNGVVKSPSDKEDYDMVENLNGVLDALDHTFGVRIDGVDRDSLRWWQRHHPKTDQLGFMTRVDVDTLDAGAHHLYMIYYQHYDDESIDTFGIQWTPFWTE